MQDQPPIFSKLFGPSPIEPIQQHMEVCTDCAEKLVPYFQATIATDWTLAAAIYEEISELENNADELKKHVRLHLPRSLFLPVSRTHLLELLHIQDKIANGAEDVAGRSFGRHLQIPASAQPEFLAFLLSSVETVRLAHETMTELNDLILSGFSQQRIEMIEAILDKLHSAEHANDLKQVELRKVFFALEKELDPVDTIFQYNIIELIADIADQAQTVGNRMMYLIAS